MADQELLVGVERCLEGIEEVTNPNAVGYDVDDDHHSFDGDVKMNLVLDALLSLDEGLLIDVYLDDLFGLDEDLRSPVLDNFLDVSDQMDEGYLCLVDVFADDVYVVEVGIVLPVLLPVLDVEVADVVLLLYHDGEVVEDDDY